MSVLNYPLTNVQMELLKLFSTNMTDEEVIELKGVIARFYAQKATAEADKIWDERGLTNEEMEKWLNENS